MMNPTTITNGGSLEDCHTNFFALTDLCGIRWRKFVHSEPTSDPLNDPILRSYARCLQVNILSVWRRIPTKKNDPYQNHMFDHRMPNTITYPPLSLKTSKELWIFWYGEEPDWSELLVPELVKNTVETAEGSWENGINYDCRSLLFKALHNLIERCLLSRGVVRLGKWFVQPCSRRECSLENGSHHISFSFGFFVHGESTVCTSMDLRIHPNVRQLTHEHLKEAALSSDYNQYPVILAPFGLAGTLTGKFYRPTDTITKKTLKEWSIFYPLLNRTESHSPPVVEVVAGGVKMCYPARYVLVADTDSESFSFKTIAKMLAEDDANEIENENKLCEPIELESFLSERVWQECVVSSQLTKTTAPTQPAGSTPSAAADEESETTEKPSDFENPTCIKTCNCPIRESPHCSTHLHNQQLISNLMSSIPTQLDSPSSPDSSSPYSTYPPSVSPTKCDENVLPSMSPIHSFDLSNFSDTPNEVMETHSPYMFSADQQHASGYAFAQQSSSNQANSGEDGGGDGAVDAEQSQAIKKIKLEMDDEDERREIKTESKGTCETDQDDGRTGSECNDLDESGMGRPLDSAMSCGSRRSSGHDVHDDSDSSKHGHTDAESVRSSSKQFEMLLSGSDNLVDSQIVRGDLNAVGDDPFEIDTNHSTLNFDCFGTVNDDVMESAFDEGGVLGGVECEKSSAKNVESGEQRRREADNSDDDDSGDDSDDSSENDDDSSDSDDSDDESNTPNDDVSKANSSATATAATTEKGDAEREDRKDEEHNDGRPRQNGLVRGGTAELAGFASQGASDNNVDADNFKATEAKRTKDGDGGSSGDGQGTSATPSTQLESAADTEESSKNAANAVSERHQCEGNENSNNSAASVASHANANDDSKDGSGSKLAGEATTDTASKNAEKKSDEDKSEKLGSKSKSNSESAKVSGDSKRIKSEPNSRNISPQHRSDGGNGNHSADEVLLGSKEKSSAKLSAASAELRRKVDAARGGGEKVKSEQFGATRNLLDAAMDILRDTGDDKSNDHFGLGSEATDALESGAHLGDSPGINLDDSVNLESLDAVANLLSTDLDLDSDDNHDIFGALDNDQLDSISDSNSEDGIGHSTKKDLKLENPDSVDDPSAKKSESASAVVGASASVDESKSSSLDAKPLPCLEYKSWANENPTNEPTTISDASIVSVKSENIAAGDAETIEKPSAIDALVNAPLLTSIKRELDCNEAMSNDTEEDSNGNDFHAAMELQMKRRQSPENALDSIVKVENEVESKSENSANAAALAGDGGENAQMMKKSNSSEKLRRSEKVEATTATDDKSDRNNNSDTNRKAKKRPRPQFHEPTILRPSPPFNFDCLANRPTLRTHNYESLLGDDAGELNPCMLYDYSTLEAWMNHPVKRFRPNEPMTPVQRLAAARASSKAKPALQELYNRQNVVMANWSSTVRSINNNETKPLAGSTGSAGVASADTQSDYDDDDDSIAGADLSPSNLSELSPYGNIDILDPEDLDCFSEEFVHQQDWSYVLVSPNIGSVYGSSKYAPLSDIGLQGERQNFVYKPSWERAAAAESASKANSKSKNKNKNKNNKLNKNAKKNKSSAKATPSGSSSVKIKSESCGGPHSNSENNVNVGNSATASSSTMSPNQSGGAKSKRTSPATAPGGSQHAGQYRSIPMLQQPQYESDSDSHSNDEKDQNRQKSSQSGSKGGTGSNRKSSSDEKNRRKKDKSAKNKSSSSTAPTIKMEKNDGGSGDANAKSKENSGNDDNSDDSSPPYYDENSNDGNSDDSQHNENDDNSNGNTNESEPASNDAGNGHPENNRQSHPSSRTVKREPTDQASQEMCDDNSTDNLETYDECETFKSKIITVHIDHGEYDDEHDGQDGGNGGVGGSSGGSGSGKDGSGQIAYGKHKRNIETHDIIHNIEIQHYQPNDEYGDDAHYNTDSGYVDNRTDENLISHFFTFGDCDADEPDSPNESDDSDSDHSTSDDSSVSQYSPSALPPLSPYGSAPSSPVSSSSSLFGSMENIAPPVQRLPETNALILNLLLYDTSMNLFKDHNFDSCPLCVCNTGQGHVGNIRGSESGIYLPMRNNNGFDQSLAFGNSNLMPGTSSGNAGGDESERNRRAVLGNNPYVDNDPIYCTCGFSAMMNRKLSHRSGLFYDDENEITGLADDPHEVKAPEVAPNANTPDDDDFEEQTRLVQRKTFEGATQLIMEYIQEQCVSVGNSGSSLMRAIRSINFKTNYFNMENAFINFVEYSDAQTMITMALDNSRLESQYRYRKNQIQTKSSNTFVNVHKWPYIKTGIPQNNKDILSFMKNMIMPILRKSFNEKYMTRLWETPSIIQGPLTWRQFHRMASTHAGQCEPQPIPSVVVGHEKDWLSVSPYAIQYWDQLALEPYSYARDVAYIVIAPDNKFIVDEAKQFFKELSTMYEMCKLGRHSPIKGNIDGILLAETPTAGEPIIDELEDLFKLFEDNKTIEILKSYAYTCLQQLVPYLTKIANDKSIFDPEPEGFNIKDFCYREKSMSSPLFQPDTPESTYVSEKEQIISFDNGNDCDMQMPYNNTNTPTPAPTPPTPTTTEPLCLSADDDEEGVPPCIVIYILNPLPSGHESDELQRLACIAMLRCYSNILSSVPDSMRNNIKLQIISMESILEIGKNGDWLRAHDEIRCLALSIFSQSRRHLAHEVNTKILTGFGTAANLQMVIKNKDCTNRTPYKLYTPPYILSGRDEVIECNEVFGAATIDTPSSIMYCNYCLSEDQKWLLAVATDERGELLETVTINIEVTDHEHRANTSIRRQSCQKLLDFIVGIISQTSLQWRIVIGRVGRIGHGELKAWSWLLSKSNLVKTSKQLKEVCGQCSMMYLNSCPSIVSACLLTLEPDSSFRLFSDQFTPDERFSQISMQSTLCTPTDLTCTHILVLPVNAVAQTVQSFPEHHIADFTEEELFVSLNNGGQGSGNMNSMNSNNMNGGNMNSMNGNSMNGMSSKGLNGMSSGLNGMNSGLNGNGNNVNNMSGMNDGIINGIDGLSDQGSLGSGLNNMNMNGLNDLNGLNSESDIANGIDGIPENFEMDGIEGMEIDDVNMNGIDDLFADAGDWDIPASDDLSLSTDNPTVATLEPKTEPDSDTLPDNLTDSMQDQLTGQLPDSMNDNKSDMKTDFKQDPDQKPNILANLRQTIGFSGGMSGMPDKNDQQNNMGQSHNNGEQIGQILQQPLAIGFMVSTAPIGKMPPWFWANCPHLENVNPVFLKSSLHLHSPLIYQNANEYINQHFSGTHPLDSQFTTDTMRYILEGYNFLSWLAMDQNTNDRLSCLPFQIQVLIQLYNMVAAFT